MRRLTIGALLIGLALAIAFAGLFHAYGDGLIWSNGLSLTDPDDVMFGAFLAIFALGLGFVRSDDR